MQITVNDTISNATVNLELYPPATHCTGRVVSTSVRYLLADEGIETAAAHANGGTARPTARLSGVLQVVLRRRVCVLALCGIARAH
jgi:hypothetical protein